jgi:hypothetical protein
MGSSSDEAEDWCRDIVKLNSVMRGRMGVLEGETRQQTVLFI